MVRASQSSGGPLPPSSSVNVFLYTYRYRFDSAANKHLLPTMTTSHFFSRSFVVHTSNDMSGVIYSISQSYGEAVMSASIVLRDFCREPRMIHGTISEVAGRPMPRTEGAMPEHWCYQDLDCNNNRVAQTQRNKKRDCII